MENVSNCDVCGFPDASVSMRTGPGLVFRGCDECYRAECVPYGWLVEKFMAHGWGDISPAFRLVIQKTLTRLTLKADRFREDCEAAKTLLAKMEGRI